MNGWSILGIIGFFTAIVLLMAGVGLGMSEMGLFSQLGPSFGQHFETTLFIEAATPYLISSAMFFVIGIVGVAMRNQGVQDTGLSQPKVARCPMCRQNMIFVAETQRWYCPTEEKYL